MYFQFAALSLQNFHDSLASSCDVRMHKIAEISLSCSSPQKSDSFVVLVGIQGQTRREHFSSTEANTRWVDGSVSVIRFIPRWTQSGIWNSFHLVQQLTLIVGSVESRSQ